MPECRRCKRMRPSADLRRTSLGHVCLEYGELKEFSQCARIERELKQAERERRRARGREAAQATGRAEAFVG